MSSRSSSAATGRTSRASSLSMSHESQGRGTAQRHTKSPANVEATESRIESKIPFHDLISPELIAHITEKVAREVIANFSQTAAVTAHPDLNAYGASDMGRKSSSRSTSNASSPTNYPSGYAPPPTSRPFQRAPNIPPMPDKTSCDASEESTASAYSNSQLPVDNGATKRGPPGEDSAKELSAVDQKWGILFDENQAPTPRIGQVLRGIANHIINSVSPEKTIVVTPEKMSNFYALYKLDDEAHPLAAMFSSPLHGSISQLYVDLGCQHHLVQKDENSIPNVPGLTPVGFQTWMTTLICAYPEQESKRLQKIMIDMPVDADGDFVDGKPERLPKQISRHLLPRSEDRNSKRSMDEAISDFLDDVGMPQVRRPPIQNTPSAGHDASRQAVGSIPPLSQSSGPPLERERKPYSGVPTANATSSDNVRTESGRPLERERQPCVKQPGMGTRLDSEAGGSTERPRRERSNSVKSSARPEAVPVDRYSAYDGPSPQRPLTRDHGRDAPEDIYRQQMRELRRSLGDEEQTPFGFNNPRDNTTARGTSHVRRGSEARNGRGFPEAFRTGPRSESDAGLFGERYYN